ncbi:NifU family protein [Vallitaleaceae bacterium 9-2]
MEEQIKLALEDVRPALQRDGGDVEFVSVDNTGIVSLRLLGACGGCPMSTMTLKNFIETVLIEQVPGVNGVIQVQ